MILIDPPFWPAHGTVFSHLVSDASLAELHAFARAAGISERAFDLDHYDVPERSYHELIAAGATAVSGKELVRALLASGLRVKAKHRQLAPAKALPYRWDTLMPQAPELGVELISRWNEPHRHYHSATHLLHVLVSLETLSGPEVPRPVALAAWFHDAVYDGVAGDDEARSAELAQVSLKKYLASDEVAEVVRLIELTASHSPAEGDSHGALLSDSDLAILGASEADYSRYAAAVRADYAHIPEDRFRLGRSTVLHQLLELDPIFHTVQGQKLWQESAKRNLRNEIARLS